MGKSLVIVESPAKAKTINKYLGKDFIVKSSVGHIRDLPTSGAKKPVDAKARARAAALTRKMSPEEKAVHKKNKAREQLINKMGIDPENDWVAHYEVLPGKEKVVNELKKLAESADHIYLATDLDREGEAIAWHLQEAIGGDKDRYYRVVFNEITKNAITDAFKSPGALNISRVNAQQARRFLDRVVGYMVSPLLWAKIARGLSAGRVQSVAVRLIVEREREIRAFVPEEFWDTTAWLNAKKSEKPVPFQVSKQNDSGYRPASKAEVDVALKALESADYKVVKRDDKPTKTKANAPFITSTLQQAASTRLGFSVKKTMMMAQRLYEAGFITYMRTDSTNLSADAITACRDYIDEEFGKKYLPKEPVSYSNRDGAQEAHEAIRPSDVAMKGSQLSSMERDAQRLYELIWRRFVACQMVPAEYLSTSIVVKAGDFELRARGRILKFDGFTRVLPPGSKKEDDVVLPDIKVDENLALDKLEPNQNFTKPPARFSEAALVKELEKRGIGRPSTYASIISTIQDRGYVRVENRRFYAEKIGDVVTSRLLENFNDLMSFEFTANMEEELDAVADGRIDWKALLNNFYDGFSDKLDVASQDETGMRVNAPVDTDIECPSCGRHMQIRSGKTGVFLGCSGYSLPPKERCTTTMNLLRGDEVVEVTDDNNGDDEEKAQNLETQALRNKKRCELCSAAMDSYLLDENRKLHICGNSPDCHGYDVEHGTFKLKGYDGPKLECDKCGSDMQLKSGRFGKYFDCTNTECSNTRKLLKSGEPAPPKMDPVPMPELKCLKVEDTYILRDGASGLFLAASQFPKNRETRAPLVEELLSHKGEIDPKYNYLMSAPTEDPDGNKAIVRYSRKSKEQYVMSEVEGKATGWKAMYQSGKWEETLPKKKVAPRAKKDDGQALAS